MILPPDKPFADIVVRITLQLERYPVRDKRAKALAGRAVEMQVDGIVGQPLRPVPAGHLAAYLGANGAVDVADFQVGGYLLAALEGRRAQIEQHLVVESLFQAVFLGNRAAAAYLSRRIGLVQQRGKVHVLGFPVIHSQARLELIGAPDHLIHGTETEFCHPLAHFLGNEVHEVHHVGRVALEVLAQFRVLGGDAGGAGVQVADAHHHAAQGDQRPGGKPELLGAQQGGDDHIAPGFELSVRFKGHPAAQIV